MKIHLMSATAGPELLLEPNAHPAAAAYQRSIFDDGIPAASFAVDDLDEEFARLGGLGVKFIQEPTAVPGGRIAAFDDTCGNSIQLVAGEESSEP
jgi:predicted enzyme related to lactoylglutathione lyase